MDEYPVTVDLDSPPDSSELTPQEDMFALAVVECNGNYQAAYRMTFGEDRQMPLTSAIQLAKKPRVIARIRQILAISEEADLISKSAHLMELAEIRDMSKKMGAVKVALEAERSRGEVAGFYKTKVELPDGLDLELARNAKKLADFVQTTTAQLANQLPV